MANGASGAIWLAIGAVCPRGSNILLPRPGFTYCVAADPMGVECRYYNCLVSSLILRIVPFLFAICYLLFVFLFELLFDILCFGSLNFCRSIESSRSRIPQIEFPILPVLSPNQVP
jgi:hypothetical protein